MADEVNSHDTTPTVVSHGMTPGRKIKAALWLSVCVTVSALLMKFFNVPEPIAEQVVWIVGLGWGGVILGQSGIDAIATKAASKKAP